MVDVTGLLVEMAEENPHFLGCCQGTLLFTSTVVLAKGWGGNSPLGRVTLPPAPRKRNNLLEFVDFENVLELSIRVTTNVLAQRTMDFTATETRLIFFYML